VSQQIQKECHTMLCRFMFLATLVLASVAAHATTYTLEPDYTQGVFRWTHLGFSRPTAQFAHGEGTLEFDPQKPTAASVKVVIPLSTIHTGVPDLDDDLRSTDFFDTAKFPTATFTSTDVKPGTATNELLVSGNLMLHGITKPVTLAVTLLKVGFNSRTHSPTVGFDATTSIRRSDYGLGKYVPEVGDDVTIEIVCQAAESAAYAEYLRKAAERAKAREAAK
jgi:polyisoprenoid-binding protein YceI